MYFHNYDYDVFISYNRNDDADTGFVLEHLWPSLLAEGLRVRIDRDFPLGGNLPREIRYACERSAKILAVVSRNYEKSDWCLIELSDQFIKDPGARDRRIIPIVLDASFSIPYELRALNLFSVGKRADWQRNIRELIIYLYDDARDKGSKLNPRQNIRILQSNLTTLSSRLRQSQNPALLNSLLTQTKKRFHRDALNFLMVPDTSFFVDNDGMLEALTAALDRYNVAVVDGIPGIGKTYLTAHYSRTVIDYYSLLWISPRNRQIETPDDFIAFLGDQADLYGDQQIAALSKAVNVPWEQKLQGTIDLLANHQYLIVIDDNNFIDRKTHTAQFMLAKCLTSCGQKCKSRLIIASKRNPADFQTITLRAWNFETTKAFLEKRGISLDDAYAEQIHERCGGHPELTSALCDLKASEPFSPATRVVQNPEEYPYQLRQVIQSQEAATIAKIFASMSNEDHNLLTACALLDDTATDETLDNICGLKANRDPIRRLTQQLFLVRQRTGALSVGKLFKNYLKNNSQIGHFEAIGKYYLEHSESSDGNIGLVAYQGIKRLSRGKTNKLANTIRDRLVKFFISRENSESTSSMFGGAEVLINALAEFEDTPQCEQWQDLFLRVSGLHLNAGSYEKSEEILKKCYNLAKDNQFIKGDIYKELARINELRGNYPEDLRCCNIARSCFNQSHENPERAFGGVVDVLTTMGTAHFMMGDYSQAFRKLEEAEQMIGADFAFHKQKRARIRLMKGAVCCRKGQYDSCDDHLDIAYQLFSEIEEKMGCAGVLIHRGIRYLESKEWQMAREVLSEARTIFSRNPHKQYNYFALNELATAEINLGETRLAVDLYLQSLSGKVEIGDAHGTADTLLNCSKVTDYIEGPHKYELIRLLKILDKRFAGMLERHTRDILSEDLFSHSTNSLALLICDLAIQMFSWVKSEPFLREAQNVRNALSGKTHASTSISTAKKSLDSAKPRDSFSTLAEASVLLQFSPTTCELGGQSLNSELIN